MIQTPVIVTFANQKGGVGKTTLCVTFANYLVTKGVRVVVIDCDFQHSIMKCRKADIRKYGEQEMPYEVWAYEANDKAMMTSLMEKVSLALSQISSSERLPILPSFRLGMMKSLAFILSPTAFFSRSTNMRKLAVDGTVTRS